MRHRLKGWRYGLFIGGFIGFIGLNCYFTMISPMLNPEPYKQLRDEIAQRYPNKRP